MSKKAAVTTVEDNSDSESPVLISVGDQALSVSTPSVIDFGATNHVSR